MNRLHIRCTIQSSFITLLGSSVVHSSIICTIEESYIDSCLEKTFPSSYQRNIENQRLIIMYTVRVNRVKHTYCTAETQSP
jgi:hypothetical protein